MDFPLLANLCFLRAMRALNLSFTPRVAFLAKVSAVLSQQWRNRMWVGNGGNGAEWLAAKYLTKKLQNIPATDCDCPRFRMFVTNLVGLRISMPYRPRYVSMNTNIFSAMSRDQYDVRNMRLPFGCSATIQTAGRQRKMSPINTAAFSEMAFDKRTLKLRILPHHLMSLVVYQAVLTQTYPNIPKPHRTF